MPNPDSAAQKDRDGAGGSIRSEQALCSAAMVASRTAYPAFLPVALCGVVLAVLAPAINRVRRPGSP